MSEREGGGGEKKSMRLRWEQGQLDRQTREQFEKQTDRTAYCETYR